MSKKKSKSISEHFSSVSTAIAGSLRTTMAKYKSLSDTLVSMQRQIESAKEISQALFRAIDGPCWEILAMDAKYRTDDFVSAIFDAMTQTSIRRWTRKHLKLIKDAKSQLESVSRKVQKLKERFDADPMSEEGRTTALLLKRTSETKAALEHRIAYTVRKFLEIRLCLLKTLTGTTEMVYNSVGDMLTKDMLAQFATTTKVEAERLVVVDQYAVKNGRK